MSKKDSIKDKFKTPYDAVMGTNINTNDNSNNDEKVNTNMNDNPANDPILQSNKSDKELVGIYFDPDVKAALQRLNKQYGRGKQSELVNDITRRKLKDLGLL
jgi:hypothetical protein